MQRRKDLVGQICAVLRISVILTLIVQIDGRNYGNVYLCLLTLMLFEAPEKAKRRLGVQLTQTMELFVYAFVFCAEILGEVYAFYLKVPCWDVLLHGLSGFLAAAIGYSLSEFAVSGGQQLPHGNRILTAFCFSMTIAVLWEFLEWGADLAFGLDMQKDTVVRALSSVNLNSDGGNSARSIAGIADTMVLCTDGDIRSLGVGGYLDVGLQDTMGDLLVNFLGAAVFSGCCLWCGGIAAYFIPKFEKHSGEQ